MDNEYGVFGIQLNMLLGVLYVWWFDIIDLELICVNIKIVLFYIDLVNEVMESFVVYLDQYVEGFGSLKQVIIDVFNEDVNSNF